MDSFKNLYDNYNGRKAKLLKKINVYIDYTKSKSTEDILNSQDFWNNFPAMLKRIMFFVEEFQFLSCTEVVDRFFNCIQIAIKKDDIIFQRIKKQIKHLYRQLLYPNRTLPSWFLRKCCNYLFENFMPILLPRLFVLIEKSSDYHTQQTIVEIIMRHYNETECDSHLTNENNRILKGLFYNILQEESEFNIRLYLNELNSLAENPKIFSFICREIIVGNQILAQQTWVNINVLVNTMTFSLDKVILPTNNNELSLDDKDKKDIITVNLSKINRVGFNSLLYGLEIYKLSLELDSPCTSIYESTSEMLSNFWVIEFYVVEKKEKFHQFILEYFKGKTEDQPSFPDKFNFDLVLDHEVISCTPDLTVGFTTDVETSMSVPDLGKEILHDGVINDVKVFETIDLTSDSSDNEQPSQIIPGTIVEDSQIIESVANSQIIESVANSQITDSQEIQLINLNTTALLTPEPRSTNISVAATYPSDVSAPVTPENSPARDLPVSTPLNRIIELISSKMNNSVANSSVEQSSEEENLPQSESVQAKTQTSITTISSERRESVEEINHEVCELPQETEPSSLQKKLKNHKSVPVFSVSDKHQISKKKSAQQLKLPVNNELILNNNEEPRQQIDFSQHLENFNNNRVVQDSPKEQNSQNVRPDDANLNRVVTMQQLANLNSNEANIQNEQPLNISQPTNADEESCTEGFNNSDEVNLSLVSGLSTNSTNFKRPNYKKKQQKRNKRKRDEVDEPEFEETSFFSDFETAKTDSNACTRTRTRVVKKRKLFQITYSEEPKRPRRSKKCPNIQTEKRIKTLLPVKAIESPQSVRRITNKINVDHLEEQPQSRMFRLPVSPLTQPTLSSSQASSPIEFISQSPTKGKQNAQNKTMDAFDRVVNNVQTSQKSNAGPRKFFSSSSSGSQKTEKQNAKAHKNPINNNVYPSNDRILESINNSQISKLPKINKTTKKRMPGASPKKANKKSPIQKKPANIESPTRIKNQTRTENPTRTEKPTRTENLARTKNSPKTENLTRTKNSARTENPTKTKNPARTENPESFNGSENFEDNVQDIFTTDDSVSPIVAAYREIKKITTSAKTLTFLLKKYEEKKHR